jgi:DNA-binding MarR family transcriptional regulator
VALERICDLHGRYADQVNSVITGVMGRYVRDYYARKLERTSALAIAFGLGSEPSVKERTIGRAEPASDGQGLLNADERLVLEILARAKHLMTQATILAETSTRQHRLGKRTLSRIARSLEARGLLHRPAGPRKGVELTAAGRELFDGGIGTSA